MSRVGSVDEGDSQTPGCAGADKEAVHWPCLLELACLLPQHIITLTLTGPNLPATLSGADVSFQWPGRACFHLFTR